MDDSLTVEDSDTTNQNYIPKKWVRDPNENPMSVNNMYHPFPEHITDSIISVHSSNIFDRDDSYLHGKIYKITNSVTDDCYVGSTYRALYIRFNEHLRHAIYGKRSHLHAKMKEIGSEHFIIQLLEDPNPKCRSQADLLIREQYHISVLKPSLNRIPAWHVLKNRLGEIIWPVRREWDKDVDINCICVCDDDEDLSDVQSNSLLNVINERDNLVGYPDLSNPENNSKAGYDEIWLALDENDDCVMTTPVLNKIIAVKPFKKRYFSI